jgi:hypothetical protein
VESSPAGFGTGRGVIDSGGHYLEDDEESPGLYICDQCQITVILNTYPVCQNGPVPSAETAESKWSKNPTEVRCAEVATTP